MKAQHKPRIDLENRTRLETVIPLATPFIIFVDPSDICNFQCRFCPTGDRARMKNTPGRNHGPMEFSVFKNIIAGIQSFPEPIKVLRLYKDGEPLLNPRLADMVAYARDSGCCHRIDTTTNAALLRPQISRALIDGGLTRINISIEGMNTRQYKTFSRFALNFEKLVENIAYLYSIRKQCEVIVKINGDLISEEEQEAFFATFGDIADGVSVEHIMSCWPEFELQDVRVNTEVGIFGQPIQPVQVCPYLFYSMAVNSNASVSACFLDWERRLIVGDAIMESLTDIWNGSTMNGLRRLMLKKQRATHPVCGACGQLSHGAADNLDDYAENLLQQIGRCE